MMDSNEGANVLFFEEENIPVLAITLFRTPLTLFKFRRDGAISVVPIFGVTGCIMRKI